MLLSALSFGTLAIFVKLGYRAGLDTQQLLTFRFLLASAGMAGVSVVARRNPLRIRRRTLLALFGLGVVGYFGQSLTFFLALRSLPASLVELITYSYPAMVVLGGWLVYHRRLPGVQLVALVGSFSGVVLLVGGVRLAGGPGLLFAIASPILYTAYILIGDRLTAGIPGITAATLSIAGTALTWTAVGIANGRLRLPTTAAQWAVLAGLAVIPTMIAITTFLAALPRIGASRAALLSTAEPVVTVTLAFALLGDRFSLLQVAGAALVLASVVVLQWPQAGEDASS